MSLKSILKDLQRKRRIDSFSVEKLSQDYSVTCDVPAFSKTFQRRLKEAEKMIKEAAKAAAKDPDNLAPYRVEAFDAMLDEALFMEYADLGERYRAFQHELDDLPIALRGEQARLDKLLENIDNELDIQYAKVEKYRTVYTGRRSRLDTSAALPNAADDSERGDHDADD